MPNQTVVTREFRNGREIGQTERVLTGEEQAKRNRALRLGQFKANGSPSHIETVQALQDLVEELGL